MTDAVREMIQAQTKILGYTGPVRCYKAPDGQEYFYRQIATNELPRILKGADTNNQASVAVFVAAAACVYPKLSVDDFEAKPMGLAKTLFNRVELLSGYETDPINGFLKDTDVVEYLGWAKPTPEQIEQACAAYAGDPNIAVRLTRMLGNRWYLYRNLCAGEYAEIEASQPEDIDTAICATGVIWPQLDWGQEPYQVPVGLATRISLLSGVERNPQIEGDVEVTF